MKKAVKYCPRITSLLASPDFKPGFIALTRMRCKQWDCEFCSTKNSDLWRAHLLETLCNKLPDKRWVFITLTAPSWSHSDPQKSLKKLKEAWGKIYDKLRYQNGGELSYVMVYETHLSGAFHIHALVDMGEKYDSYGVIIDDTLERKAKIRAEKRHPFCKLIKEMCEKTKIGYICHATRVKEGETGKDNQRLAVGYISKYFTKGSLEMAMPKRWRRLGTSRDIGSPATKRDKGFTWKMRAFVTPKDTDHIPHYLLTENRVLDASDFGDDAIYPSLPENA